MIDQEFTTINKIVNLPSIKKPCVPQQLVEANELMQSINRRLEDCALQWQAGISRSQWEIFNSKAMGKNPPNQHVLTCTYFLEKDLDDAFQHLLSCNTIFSQYLKNFIALLQREQPSKEITDAQNQQRSSTDVIKAKVNLYTKFVDFESALHKISMQFKKAVSSRRRRRMRRAFSGYKRRKNSALIGDTNEEPDSTTNNN